MGDEFEGGAGFEGGGDQGHSSGAGHAPAGQGRDAGAISHGAGHGSADSGASDWRSSFMDGLDEGLRDRGTKYLERRKSAADVLKSALATDGKISELSEGMKGRIKIPGESDSPEDIAAFRKSWGVPDAADAYEIWSPEGQAWDDSQKAGIEEFLADAHGAHLSQKQVDVCLQALARANALTMQDFGRRGQAVATQTEAALREVWGREYQANRTLADREMVRVFGEHAPEIANLKLQDGSFLGDNRWFALGMSALAKAGADHGMLENGDGGVTPSRDQRLDEIYEMQTKDPKKYRSRAIQDELIRLESSKLNRGPRR
jgi:hypothetical protein